MVVCVPTAHAMMPVGVKEMRVAPLAMPQTPATGCCVPWTRMANVNCPMVTHWVPLLVVQASPSRSVSFCALMLVPVGWMTPGARITTHATLPAATTWLPEKVRRSPAFVSGVKVVHVLTYGVVLAVGVSHTSTASPLNMSTPICTVSMRMGVGPTGMRLAKRLSEYQGSYDSLNDKLTSAAPVLSNSTSAPADTEAAAVSRSVAIRRAKVLMAMWWVGGGVFHPATVGHENCSQRLCIKRWQLSLWKHAARVDAHCRPSCGRAALAV